jgi:hypothetical protein
VDHAKYENERQQLEAGKLKEKVKAELQKRLGVKVDDKLAWRTWKFDKRQKAEAHKQAVTLHVANNLARTRNLIKGQKLTETQTELRSQLATLETTPPNSQASSVQTSPQPTTSGFQAAFKLAAAKQQPIPEEVDLTSESGYTSDRLSRQIRPNMHHLSTQPRWL